MSLDVNEQYDKIYRFCFLRVHDRDIAEDLTQETFLRYLEHPQYHTAEKTLQLLYTIARNLCTDQFRQPKNTELEEDIPSDENIEDSVLESFALKEALDSLPPEDKELIMLRYINDVPIGVIGELYGISRFAVNRRIKSILKCLKNEIGKEELQ